jgi:hypothetical protein
VDSHQKVWNAIDAIAWNARLTPSGLAKAAGLDVTAFNPSKRVGPGGRQRWPSVETVQKVLDATGTTWFAFARLMEESTANASHVQGRFPDRQALTASSSLEPDAAHIPAADATGTSLIPLRSAPHKKAPPGRRPKRRSGTDALGA